MDDDLDPTGVNSLEDLAACLRQVHLRADKPAYRELEQQTIRANGLLPGTRLKRARLGRTTLSDVMLGRKFPGKAFMLTFVDACGIDLENDRRWAQAWDRLAERYLIQGALAETEQLRQQVAAALTARAEADRARQLAEDAARQEHEEARSEIGRLQAELAARTAELEQTRTEAAQAREAFHDAHKKAERMLTAARAEAARAGADRAAASAQQKLAEDAARQEHEEARSEIGRLQAELAARTAELEQTRTEAAQTGEAHEEAGDILLSSSQRSLVLPRFRKRYKGQDRAEPPSWLPESRSPSPEAQSGPVPGWAERASWPPPDPPESSSPSPEAQGGPAEDRPEPPSWLPRWARENRGQRVRMPQLGEGCTEATVTLWLKKEGERVEADEVLLEVSTDRVDTVIQSPVSGILRVINVAEDETVAVGSMIAIIELDPADRSR